MNMVLSYTRRVMRHFLKPKYMGKINDANAIAQVTNPICSDTMKVYLKIAKNKEGKEFIKDAKFQTLGCPAAIACSDVACGLIKGKTLAEAKKITKRDIINKFGKLPPIKYHCSILGEDAIKKAIKNYENRKKDGFKSDSN